MKKNIIRFAVAAMAVAVAVQPAFAEVPLDYYQSLNGLTGEQLKNAAHELISNNVTMLSYGSGSNGTWTGFYTTDRLDDGSVRDRYSNETFYFGSEGNAVSGMNIEHSFPKSWWGGSKNNAYKDLFNLMPCEQKINSSKSNYPMGKVLTPGNDNGCTKIGYGEDGNRYWEPADKWKGDFARTYMYMATAYQNFTWQTANGLIILQNDTYETFVPEAIALYMEWALDDDVDEIEINRNDAVCSFQGNRNPYVDFPNMMQYVWGDSIGVPFNIYKTRHQNDPIIVAPEPITGFKLIGNGIQIPAGYKTDLTVRLENERDVTAFQCIIKLPEGASFVTEDDEVEVTLSSRASKSHTAVAQQYDARTIKVICYSSRNIAFKDNEGTLFTVPFRVPTKWGEYTIEISNIEITEPDETAHKQDSTEVYLFVSGSMEGDVNCDGVVSISDVVVICNYILGETPDAFNADAADLDHNGDISISDVVALVNLIVNN